MSMITVSCKETKKEEVQDDTSVEMTEEGSEAGGMDATEDDVSSDNAAAGAGAAGTAAGEGAEATMEAAEGIEAESKDVEALVVPEGVISEELADTPVIYPGCTGSVEEIRACNKESFVAYIKSEFNHEIGKEAGLKKGDYEIGVVIHVNKAGRVFSLRVTAPDPALKTEMERVVNSTPHVVPATEAGEAVGVSVKFLVDFKVEKL
ncbi:hypothetical protein [Lutimonas sp.]|uniref:hypothetical protein n=1 Tax=Lutimonas sp. TaxID=1872403 RepID=UPI003C7528AA